ncbi:MAG: hypothetical protein ACYTG5_20145 [Planctomycetota bacterium]|jgi:hypothetical protein
MQKQRHTSQKPRQTGMPVWAGALHVRKGVLGTGLTIISMLSLLSTAGLAQEKTDTSNTRRFAGDPGAVTEPQAPQETPSFARIFQAENEGNYHLYQVRRILDGENWLALSEELWSAPAVAGGKPRFRLTLDNIEGRSFSDAELADRSASFAQRAPFLHLHGSFRVHNAELAEQNYLVLDLGPGLRIGRPVTKVILVPKQVGSTPWVLEIDHETGYPLYREEYDARGQVVSVLEVVDFQHGFRATPPEDFEWWTEKRDVREFEDFQAALREFPGIVAQPEPNFLPSGYEPSEYRTIASDLNTEETLVQTFSNGIDEVFLLTTANATRPEVLRNRYDDERQVSLMVFEDQNSTQLMFFKGNLRYQILGRSSADQLESFARSMIRKAFQ